MYRIKSPFKDEEVTFLVHIVFLIFKQINLNVYIINISKSIWANPDFNALKC